MLEGLEDRIVLYSPNGGVWTYPVRITYSFVPDGTNIGGTSNLFATMNAYESQATWQQAVEQAAAIWEQSANLNLALVGDNGAPEGTSGYQQGDTRFGDIRIGMTNLGANGILAFTETPPPINGGTDAGDITFNSYYNWSPNGGYDFETVALHELGHSLGLGESKVQGSVMFATYSGVNINPSSDDLAGIQSLYGPPPAPYNSNHAFTSAYNLSSMINSQGQLALANQSITSLNDRQYWYVNVPSTNSGTMTVSLQSTNLSSLAPRLAVYNSAQQLIQCVALANVYGGTATVTVKGVTAGQGYYLVVGAASGIGSVGAYGLEANFGSLSQPPIAPPNTVVASQPDQGGGVGYQYAAAGNAPLNGIASWLDTLETQLANGTFVLSSWTSVVSTSEVAALLKSAAPNKGLAPLLGVLGLIARASSPTPAAATAPSVVVDIAGTALSLPASPPPPTVVMFPGSRS